MIDFSAPTKTSQVKSLQDLKKYRHWVCFTPDKVPVNPRTGGNAMPGTPGTWSTFVTAKKRYESNKGSLKGIGYMFLKEQCVTGVDLDKCISEDGTISDFAQRIVSFLNSYTETSPSGRGLHVWVRGSIPKNIGPDKTGMVKIEMYDHERYFTITGKHLEGTPNTFEDRQEQLEQLHSEVLHLRKQAKLTQPEMSARAQTSTPRAAPGDSPYGLKALQTECDDLAGAANGSRNHRLNQAAFSCGQLVGGGELTQVTVENALIDAARVAGLDEVEIEKTMRSGLNAGMNEPRTRPANYRDGSTGGNILPTTGDKDPDTKFILQCLSEGEYGDSLLFAHLFRGLVIYDHTAGAWYTWKGHWWEEDITGDIKHKVSGKLASVYLRAVAGLYEQVSQQEANAEASGDDQEIAAAKERIARSKKKIKELTERAFSLRQVGRCKNILYFAQSHEGMGIISKQWDCNPWLLAVPNGVIDLKTGECRDGKPEDYIRTVAPTHWRGLNAPAPRWERCFEEFFEDRDLVERQQVIGFLRRFLGYGITGLVSEQVFGVFYGEDGRNGKDTIQHALNHTLGAASSAISKDVLLNAKMNAAGAPSPHLMDLQGKRLAWASEPEKGARFNVSQMKELSGGGEFAARGPFEKKITKITPSHLLLLLTNHKPEADADDTPFWDRLRLITFNMRFVDNPSGPNERKKDTTLWNTLHEEASGILAWLVRGCLEWQEQGLNAPECVLRDGSKYREEEDPIKPFLDECCVINEHCKVKASVIYNSFKQWYEANNPGKIDTNSTVFGRKLTKKNFRKETTRNGVFYIGIGLLSDESVNSFEKPFTLDEAASGANLEETQASNREQCEGFFQKVPNLPISDNQNQALSGKTIHTIHTQEDMDSIEQPIERAEVPVNSFEKPFTPEAEELLHQVEELHKTKTQIFWHQPTVVTGYYHKNGFIKPGEFLTRLNTFLRSGNDAATRAAIEVMKKEVQA